MSRATTQATVTDANSPYFWMQWWGSVNEGRYDDAHEMLEPAPEPREVCAWCRADMGPAAAGCRDTSHGICLPCVEKHFGCGAEVAARRKARCDAALALAVGVQ